MEKACASTIWRTCPSDVQGNSEPVRRESPTLGPCLELYRKTCSNGPHALGRRRFDILILNGTKLVHAKLRWLPVAGKASFHVAHCSRIISQTGSSMGKPEVGNLGRCSFVAAQRRLYVRVA